MYCYRQINVDMTMLFTCPIMGGFSKTYNMVFGAVSVYSYDLSFLRVGAITYMYVMTNERFFL